MSDAPMDVSEDATEAARAFLTHVLGLAGFEVAVEAEVEEDTILLDVSGPHAEELVTPPNRRSNPEVIDALSHLTQRAAFRGVRDTKTVLVDAAGFRTRRVELMARVADTISEKISKGIKMDVYGMNSVDRKVVHRHLSARDEISTNSVGNGIFRRLTIRNS